MRARPLNNKILKRLLVICVLAAMAELSTAQISIDFPHQELDRELNTVYNLQRIGKFESALSYLDRLKEKYGSTPQILSLYKNIYIDAKMYPELEELIRKQLQESPGDPLPLAELGNVRYLRDDPVAADSLWNLALKRGEKNQAVYIYVANYKLRYGDYEGAIETFLAGRKQFGIPDMFSGELANIYESQRNYPAAVNEYLIKLVNGPEIFLSISPKILELVEDTDDVEGIIAAIRSKIDENKNAEVLYEILGDIYITENDMKKAFETYRIMGKGNDDDGESLYKFAGRCLDFKAYGTAVEAVDEYLAKSKRLNKKDMALLVKGEAMKRGGHPEEARLLLQDLYNSTIDSRIKAESGYLIGEISSANGDCAGALETWRNTVKIARHQDIRIKILYDMAQCQIKLREYADAESLLTIVGNGETGDELSQGSLFQLAELDLFRGRYAEAQAGYMNIIRMFPGSDYANDAVERISVISTLGIDNSGIAADNRLLDAYSRAVEYRMQGRYVEAASILLGTDMAESAIGEQALFLAGNIYAEATMEDKAIDIYKSYIDKYPEGFFADRVYLAMGDIYLGNPQTVDLAREVYGRILEAFQEGPVTELARERLRLLESQDRIG
jgi:tetratricopeptide (TPR) repeat protein